MSKKKTTSTKGKKPVDDPEPWINELKTLTINDENWSCNVNMIVEENPYNSHYITAAENLFSKKHERPHIKIVSNPSLAIKLLEMSYNVNVYGITNGYKKLCEAAVKYCSASGFLQDIPTSMLAYIIKYYIYNLKLKNLEEIRVIETYHQNTKKMRDESLLLTQNIGKGVPLSKDKASRKDIKTATTTAKKTGKDKNLDNKVTNLRKRGEEILDTIMEPSDEPEDGPHLYIILSSFRKAHLPLELLKLQVPLTSLVKLYSFCTIEQNMISEIENSVICRGFGLIPQGVIFRERRFSNPMEEHLLSIKILDSFWSEFCKILRNKANVLFFKDTIFLKFYPKLYERLPFDDHVNSNCVYERIQKSFYNQICHLQYDIQDVKRQHQNFINNLINRNLESKEYINFNEMNVYKNALEEIPPEIINVPFILDCIIVQVVHLVDEKHISSPKLSDANEANLDVVKSSSNEVDEHLKLRLRELDAIHDIFQGECIIKEEPKILPTVLIYGDEVGNKSRLWDKGEHVKKITCKLLRLYWNRLIMQRVHFDDDLSHTEFSDNKYLFHLMKDTGNITLRDKLCNIPCEFNDKYFIVEDKASVFCLDTDSVENYDNLDPEKSNCNIYHCTDIDPKTLLHYEDPSKGHYLGQIYDAHSYCFEEMTSDIMLQKLFDSLENFNCIDLQQDCFKNKLFVKFHHKKTCSKEEYLIGTLKTKTALRDFYDYSIDEEFYWLNEQEIAYDKVQNKKEQDRLTAALNKLQYLKNREHFRTNKICSETNFVMRNTLKQTETGHLPLASVPSYVEDESQLKNDSTTLETHPIESFDIDLPNRVQFSEKRQHYIISLNSQLLIKVLSRLYKDDALSLQCTIHGHTLYFYQLVGNEISTNFHLIHSSGMIFYFKKNLINNSSFKKQDDINQQKVLAAETKISEFIEGNDIFLKPLLYQLTFSLPSTLCLELINPNNIPLYIKQYYLNTISAPIEIQNEKCRCYLSDGTLLKFMTDETIVVYYACGEMFNCEILLQADEKMPSPNNIAQKINEIKQKGEMKSKQHKDELISISPEKLLEEKVIIKSYDYISVEGRRFSVKEGFVTELESLFCKSFTDIFNGIIVTERSDGTMITHNKEGTLFVDFPDGSRITTTASFAPSEFFFSPCEAADEGIENPYEEMFNSNLNLDQESDISNQLLDELEESFEQQKFNFQHQCEGFTVINIQHYFENLNYSSIFIDLNNEEVNINLPFNVDISFTSEGLYTINFDEKAEFFTGYEQLIFKELNSKNMPEFTINIGTTEYNNLEEQNDSKTPTNIKDNAANDHNQNNIWNKPEKNANDKSNIPKDRLSKAEHESIHPLHNLFSCKDEYGNLLTVDSNATIDMELVNSYICKCDTIENNRMFILDTNYNGLEVFSPEFMDMTVTETNNHENSVIQVYGSLDHQTMIILKPITLNDREKWLMPLKKMKYFFLYELPSTFNDENTFFNPFRRKKSKIEAKLMPRVLLTRVINRTNCNIHLQEETFIQNKKTADLLRLKKYSELAIELFELGNIPFCKADKAFIQYIKENVIGSMIAKVRKRVIKRLEMRKIKEYTNILVNRLLLPYFDSAQGAVFIILLDLITMSAQLCSEDRNKLEKLFYKPLKHLQDEDLNYMHDRIAPLTLSRFCNCNEDKELCQLRILLLAGRTLHDFFPDMISVFHSYGNNVKRDKETEKKKATTIELKKLLYKPSDELTEEDLITLHDILRTIPIIKLCSCSENPLRCKLKAVLLSCVTLGFIFPNLAILLKSLDIQI